LKDNGRILLWWEYCYNLFFSQGLVFIERIQFMLHWKN